VWPIEHLNRRINDCLLKRYNVNKHGGYIHEKGSKGDGKEYQLRVRTDNRFDGISYRYRFATQPETWMNIRVPFSEFVPVFRGRILSNVSPISPEQIQQVGFLISDKQAGKYRIEIDWTKAYKWPNFTLLYPFYSYMPARTL
jgi:hypothetical protein